MAFAIDKANTQDIEELVDRAKKSLIQFGAKHFLLYVGGPAQNLFGAGLSDSKLDIQREGDFKLIGNIEIYYELNSNAYLLIRAILEQWGKVN